MPGPLPGAGKVLGPEFGGSDVLGPLFEGSEVITAPRPSSALSAAGAKTNSRFILA